MDPPPPRLDDQIRFSNSPRRYTQVIQSPQSPKRSLYPEHEGPHGGMESIDSQADFGHRTTDFFEAEESDDETGLIHDDSGMMPREPQFGSVKRRSSSPGKRKPPPPSARSLVSQCEPQSKRVTLHEEPEPDSPDSQGYHRLDSNLNEQIPHANHRDSTGSMSYVGSVEELDMSQHGKPAFPKPARISMSSAARSSKRWTSDPLHNNSHLVSRMSADSEKLEQRLDQRLGVHAVAYDFLLRGLLNDQEVMRRERPVESLVNRLSGIRNSMLPAGLNPHDPKIFSPKDHLYQPQASMDVDRESFQAGTDSNRNSRKVHVVPPPIDTDTARRGTPQKMVKTPYPREAIRRKDFGSPSEGPLPSALEPPEGASESILTLSINSDSSHRRTRITTLTIPASNDYTAIHTSKPHHPPKPFDDQELFLQLRQSYKALSGPFRLFSARSLHHISVSGSATRAADAGYGWLHQPRSPRVLAYKGLHDTFSEEKILLHYRRPAMGRSRYAFVHWAHRLAAAPSSPPPPETPDANSGLVRRLEQPEGLEFVVGWSVKRIVMVLMLVILLAVAAALLWIFLGRNTPAMLPAHGGFRDAGDRVGAGVLIGLAVLGVGMCGFTGWLGVSWLVL